MIILSLSLSLSLYSLSPLLSSLRWSVFLFYGDRETHIEHKHTAGLSLSLSLSLEVHAGMRVVLGESCVNSPSLNHGFPFFLSFLFLHGLRLILVLVAFVARLRREGWRLMRRRRLCPCAMGFRCVPEDGVTVEKCAHFDWRGSRT